MNKYLYGNCLELMSDIPDKSIDMVLCDLPQAITRNRWDKIIDPVQMWKQYNRIVKADGAIVLFANQPFTSQLVLSNPKMFRYSLVWQKTTSTGFLNAKKMPLRAHEDIVVFYKKLPKYYPQMSQGHKPVNSYTKHSSDGENYGATKIGISGGGSTERYPTSILKYATDKQKSALHSTQKPIALLEHLILSYTQPGDIVLDNAAGVGSTHIACINTGRRSISMENDEVIYQKGLNRIYEHTNSRTATNNSSQ